MAKAAIGQGQKEFGKVRCQYRHSQASVLVTIIVVVVMVVMMMMIIIIIIYLLTTQPRNFSNTSGTK
jgi:RsiW-degrading membrane proteinase PrsW (M82 family)